MIFNPAHPGEVLRDYLGEMSVSEAASRLGLTRAHLPRPEWACGHHRQYVFAAISGPENLTGFLVEDANAI
jgi:hypothetical protein